MTYSLTVGAIDVSDTVRAEPGLAWRRGVAVERLLAPEAGVLTATINNQDLAYNDDGTPLLRGATVTLLTPGMDPQFLGTLQTPRRAGRFRAETIEAKALGALGLIARAQRVGTEVLVDPTIDECLDALCDAVGVPMGLRDFDVSTTTLNYWTLSDLDTPWGALLELWHTEGPSAAIYEDRQGRICFRQRDWLVTDAPSIAVQGTYGYAAA